MKISSEEKRFQKFFFFLLISNLKFSSVCGPNSLKLKNVKIIKYQKIVIVKFLNLIILENS